MKEVDLAWAAGFLDGEGCISIRKMTGKTNHKLRYNISLSASQVTPVPLQKLQDLFGGSLNKSHPPYNHWQWGVVAKQAENALKLLLPYLLNKKEQAILALEFRKYVPKPGQQFSTADGTKMESLREEIRQLKIMERV